MSFSKQSQPSGLLELSPGSGGSHPNQRVSRPELVPKLPANLAAFPSELKDRVDDLRAFRTHQQHEVHQAVVWERTDQLTGSMSDLQAYVQKQRDVLTEMYSRLIQIGRTVASCLGLTLFDCPPDGNCGVHMANLLTCHFQGGPYSLATEDERLIKALKNQAMTFRRKVCLWANQNHSRFAVPLSALPAELKLSARQRSAYWWLKNTEAEYDREGQAVDAEERILLEFLDVTETGQAFRESPILDSLITVANRRRERWSSKQLKDGEWVDELWILMASCMRNCRLIRVCFEHMHLDQDAVDRPGDFQLLPGINGEVGSIGVPLDLSVLRINKFATACGMYYFTGNHFMVMWPENLLYHKATNADFIRLDPASVASARLTAVSERPSTQLLDDLLELSVHQREQLPQSAQSAESLLNSLAECELSLGLKFTALLRKLRNSILDPLPGQLSNLPAHSTLKARYQLYRLQTCQKDVLAEVHRLDAVGKTYVALLKSLESAVIAQGPQRTTMPMLPQRPALVQTDVDVSAQPLEWMADYVPPFTDLRHREVTASDYLAEIEQRRDTVKRDGLPLPLEALFGPPTTVNVCSQTLPYQDTDFLPIRADLDTAYVYGPMREMMCQVISHLILANPINNLPRFPSRTRVSMEKGDALSEGVYQMHLRPQSHQAKTARNRAQRSALLTADRELSAYIGYVEAKASNVFLVLGFSGPSREKDIRHAYRLFMYAASTAFDWGGYTAPNNREGTYKAFSSQPRNQRLINHEELAIIVGMRLPAIMRSAEELKVALNGETLSEAMARFFPEHCYILCEHQYNKHVLPGGESWSYPQTRMEGSRPDALRLLPPNADTHPDFLRLNDRWADAVMNRIGSSYKFKQSSVRELFVGEPPWSEGIELIVWMGTEVAVCDGNPDRLEQYTQSEFWPFTYTLNKETQKCFSRDKAAPPVKYPFFGSQSMGFGFNFQPHGPVTKSSAMQQSMYRLNKLDALPNAPIFFGLKEDGSDKLGDAEPDPNMGVATGITTSQWDDMRREGVSIAALLFPFMGNEVFTKAYASTFAHAPRVCYAGPKGYRDKLLKACLAVNAWDFLAGSKKEAAAKRGLQEVIHDITKAFDDVFASWSATSPLRVEVGYHLTHSGAKQLYSTQPAPKRRHEQSSPSSQRSPGAKTIGPHGSRLRVSTSAQRCSSPTTTGTATNQSEVMSAPPALLRPRESTSVTVGDALRAMCLEHAVRMQLVDWMKHLGYHRTDSIVKVLSEFHKDVGRLVFMRVGMRPTPSIPAVSPVLMESLVSLFGATPFLIDQTDFYQLGVGNDFVRRLRRDCKHGFMRVPRSFVTDDLKALPTAPSQTPDRMFVNQLHACTREVLDGLLSDAKVEALIAALHSYSLWTDSSVPQVAAMAPCTLQQACNLMRPIICTLLPLESIAAWRLPKVISVKSARLGGAEGNGVTVFGKRNVPIISFHVHHTQYQRERSNSLELFDKAEAFDWDQPSLAFVHYISTRLACHIQSIHTWELSPAGFSASLEDAQYGKSLVSAVSGAAQKTMTVSISCQGATSKAEMVRSIAEDMIRNAFLDQTRQGRTPMMGSLMLESMVRDWHELAYQGKLAGGALQRALDSGMSASEAELSMRKDAVLLVTSQLRAVLAHLFTPIKWYCSVSEGTGTTSRFRNALLQVHFFADEEDSPETIAALDAMTKDWDQQVTMALAVDLCVIKSSADHPLSNEEWLSAHAKSFEQHIIRSKVAVDALTDSLQRRKPLDCFVSNQCIQSPVTKGDALAVLTEAQVTVGGFESNQLTDARSRWYAQYGCKTTSDDEEAGSSDEELMIETEDLEDEGVPDEGDKLHNMDAPIRSRRPLKKAAVKVKAPVPKKPRGRPRKMQAEAVKTKGRGCALRTENRLGKVDFTRRAKKTTACKREAQKKNSKESQKKPKAMERKGKKDSIAAQPQAIAALAIQPDEWDVIMNLWTPPSSPSQGMAVEAQGGAEHPLSKKTMPTHRTGPMSPVKKKVKRTGR